ncbi:hypothetical protein [Arthrobacter sp. MA-N2]|uniref:hypothetical protein n=1 Tax=Arthrobacter sp. MA-N2 TaxID=1101188 RepID=UPI0012DEFB90|nr:hypothetical protein [Arthrobacter sp. MA-N2]
MSGFVSTWATERADRYGDVHQNDGVKEIVQLQQATAFVDATVNPGTTLTHGLVREIHRISVAGLEREGDRTPGAYRLSDVTISGSAHRPPAPGDVHSDMTSLLDTIADMAPRPDGISASDIERDTIGQSVEPH